MKCRICKNESSNISFELKEMMYGFKDRFEYIECSACGCIQIKEPPADMSKYYPADYYSYKNGKKLKKDALFKQIQCQSIVRNRLFLKNILAFKYKPPQFYQTLKLLKIPGLSSPILDIGSGNGELLKDFYKVGYKDLTGIDPYIKSDIFYNENLRIEKKEIFEISGKYQAIMLNHSLEHMDDHPEVLSKLYSILSKNGRILIRIPIVSKPLMQLYGANVVSLDAPRHFYIHTFRSISLLLEKTGFVIENAVYDAHEFSFWGSHQYQQGISLHNHPESFLNKKTFPDEQIANWKIKIEELNKKRQSDNLALYIKKRNEFL